MYFKKFNHLSMNVFFPRYMECSECYLNIVQANAKKCILTVEYWQLTS